MTPEEIVAGYFENRKTQSDDTFWAWEAVNELCNDLAGGSDITLRLIESADDELYLYYVAAGPLEDLIKRHGAKAVALLEKAADGSSRVREALTGVWPSPAHEGFAEWERVLRSTDL